MKNLFIGILTFFSVSTFALENNETTTLEFDEADLSTVRIKSTTLEGCEQKRDDSVKLLNGRGRTVVDIAKCRDHKLPSGETLYYSHFKFHKYLDGVLK